MQSQVKRVERSDQSIETQDAHKPGAEIPYRLVPPSSKTAAADVVSSIPADAPVVASELPASAAPKAAQSSGKPEKSTTEPVKRAFPPPADVPTQTGPKGIKFDGNEGGRVVLPEGDWHVRLSDIDTGNILFDTHIGAGVVRTRKKYFCRFRLEIWECAKESRTETVVLNHEYNASGKDVLIQFPVGTLGDTMGWFPYAEKFRLKHDCKLTCSMAEKIIPLFRAAYPEIRFITQEETQPEQFYATYNVGLYFGDDHIGENQPCDFRLVGLHRTAGHILGVDPTEEPPKIVIPDAPRPIAEPYVVVATQSTTQSKYWNNPSGWLDLVRYLNECGYRVVCIDQKSVHGGGLVWNQIPHGVEDQTGDRPLAERANWLKHADFFIGLSSGLSWLAWAMRIPVVMISGFTHPINEFTTPYRVINYNVCNSCWNDMRIQFDHKDFLWCPRQKDTPRQFECTRLITAAHVKTVLQTIPGFKGNVDPGQKRASDIVGA